MDKFFGPVIEGGEVVDGKRVGGRIKGGKAAAAGWWGDPAVRDDGSIDDAVMTRLVDERQKAREAAQERIDATALADDHVYED